VVLVHGGPHIRYFYGFHPWHQFLANRGYAVLAVNFRGSSGFGKSFWNAADLEWGGKMSDDLVDAVSWAVAQRIADPERVAIMGMSYGGYATLVGMTRDADVFACGVDLYGPADLAAFHRALPQSATTAWVNRWFGDPNTEAGAVLARERSPLFHIDQLTGPLLIAQGANDVRVARAESDKVVAAAKARGVPVTYLLYADEGHDFVRQESWLSFWAITEQFLAKCLGGQAEPIGTALEGASLQVLEGAEHVDGLSNALAAQATAPG
jgi:dipeptidyl aminopeptidase/acylaminoacyl peptidase